jgi:hypothetical protein
MDDPGQFEKLSNFGIIRSKAISLDIAANFAP